MSDAIRIRLGIEGARELEIEVEDHEAVRDAVKAAVGGDEPLVWIVDAKGNSYGLVTTKLAFIQIEGDEKGEGIGFGVGG